MSKDDAYLGGSDIDRPAIVTGLEKANDSELEES